MVKFLFVACILAAWALIFVNCEQSKSKAPAPSSSNCTELIFKMSDCLPYLTKGGSQTKPEATCCNGYKTVVKTNAECICEAIKNSASMDIDIDISKAMKLPSACGDKSPHLNISCFPSGEAPSKPPTPSKTPVNHHHKTPQVPAPAPVKAAAAAAITKMPAFSLLSLAIIPFFYSIIA